MPEIYFVVPEKIHNELVEQAYRHRHFTKEESADAARFCAAAAKHGIRTHNAIKALHLDELFGSKTGGCIPGATIREIPTRCKAVQIWDAGRKLGQSVAYRAMETCMRLANEYGVGLVSVDNAFHYLWGGGYVMDAADKGYLAYTACTSTLAEVVPFGGKSPTLGTNPHSWGFPTRKAVGFPIVIDWATSTIAMGRVQQLKREGKALPPDSAVDSKGRLTTDPHQVAALLPFGGHKGYGLGLIDELLAAFIGGSIPTKRGRRAEADDKNTTSFFFQAIHPDALNAGAFAKGRTQQENIQAVIRNILGPGNENCLLPGQLEAEAANRSLQHGGLLFSQAELDSFAEIAKECGAKTWNPNIFKQVSI